MNQPFQYLGGFQAPQSLQSKPVSNSSALSGISGMEKAIESQNTPIPELATIPGIPASLGGMQPGYENEQSEDLGWMQHLFGPEVGGTDADPAAVAEKMSNPWNALAAVLFGGIK
jgi:hypothetical protein